VAAQQVRIEGLRELQRDLRLIDKTMPRELRKANKAAAEIVAVEARKRTPVHSGRARRSLVARAEQRSASVKGGGARVPYFAWLDFGGSVGRNKSVHREVIKGGRIIYPALAAKREQVADEYEELLAGVFRLAGLNYRRVGRG
jgi:hypothetical protein